MKGPNRQYIESLKGETVNATLRGGQQVSGVVGDVDGRTVKIGDKPFWIPYITNVEVTTPCE